MLLGSCAIPNSERGSKALIQREEKNLLYLICQPGLRGTDRWSCLGHLQRHEAMADSPMVLVPHEQLRRALSILREVKILGPELRAAQKVVKLIVS